MMSRKHYLVIEVECLDSQGSRQAADRVKGWLEAFGHTACSHGFDFISVSANLRHAMQEEKE